MTSPAPTFTSSSHASAYARSTILAASTHTGGGGGGGRTIALGPPSPRTRQPLGSTGTTNTNTSSVHLPAQPTHPPSVGKSSPIAPGLSTSPSVSTMSAGGSGGGHTRATSSSVTNLQVTPPTDAQRKKYDSGGSATDKESTREKATADTTEKSAAIAALSALLPADWQEDSSAKACHHCHIKFSLLTRKHHCRSCGLIHCDNCSKYRAPVPSKNYMERVRVCGKCYYSLKKRSGGRTSSGTPSATTNATVPDGASPRSRNGSGESTSAGGGGSSSKATVERGQQERSHRSGRSNRGSEVDAHALADELQSQLSALHSLHSSYQPEHHYLTSLLSNASQLEQTYIATIQFLYDQLQAQQHQQLIEWHTHQAHALAQQRQIDHLEEQLRNTTAHSSQQSVGAAASAAAKGASPVVGHRAASPSLAISTASMPSSRASPGSHAHSFALSLQQGQQQQQLQQQQQQGQPHSQLLAAASAASSPPIFHFSLSSSPHPPALPPLPFVFNTSLAPSPTMPSSSLSPQQQQPPQRIYDAASEEAYLEPPEQDLPNLSAAAAAAAALLLSASSDAPPALLSVTEPPSPPSEQRDRARSPPSGRDGDRVQKRATSNPTNASGGVTHAPDRPRRRPTKEGKAIDHPNSPSVQTLLEAIGM